MEKKVLNDQSGSINVITNEDAKKQWKELEDTLLKKRSFINPELRIFDTYIEHLEDFEVVKENNTFYRARKNEKEKSFSHDDIKAPQSHLSKSGRLNPVGISYLYLSDSPETCCAEVRPWVGAKVTVAEFYLVRDLIMKDLRLVNPKNTFQKSVKEIVKRNFSRPVTPDDGELDYIITQCITEYVKYFAKPKNEKYGEYDGIIYGSSINEGGYNLLIFDPEVMQIKKEAPLKVYSIKKINVTIQAIPLGT